MSGGTFEYRQYAIDQIASEIEDVIKKNKVVKNPEDIYSWDLKPDFCENSKNVKQLLAKYKIEDVVEPWGIYYYDYPDSVIDKFKEAVNYLKLAAIYAQRIDWLMAGDDGEETFLKRLEEDINNLKTENK
jgi:hypothetical protein